MKLPLLLKIAERLNVSIALERSAQQTGDSVAVVWESTRGRPMLEKPYTRRADGTLMWQKAIK